jgi:hypothetical protein
MPVRLPLVPSVGNYRVGTTLDGTQYILDVLWNSREEAWYLDILAEDETVILIGSKIALGAYIGRRNTSPLFPHGTFFIQDLSGAGAEATYDDLGTRVVVDFWTAAELEEALE